jgi:phospholipid/cholesterol/gamma-HCH transport system ATP-binding protein
MYLSVKNLRKGFGAQVVLKDVSLSVRRGAIVTVLGKSGMGKSVFLKCLAGILAPDAGEIRFEGRLLKAEEAESRREFRRRTSYLFQNNALLDSLTALENVSLPLEQTTKLSRAEIFDRARNALRQLELEEFSGRYPGQLSGGMQKRLALARAIVTEPELVLFDEPTAGLDPVRRNAVFEMIARQQRQVGFTAIIVTHDIPEALAASDEVALLDSGVMRFQGAPEDFAASTDEAVASFRDSVSALKAAIQKLGSAQ